MKHILVVLEPSGAGLKRSSYEAITAARSVANGAPITGIAVNATPEQIQSAGAYGLTSCLSASATDAAHAIAEAATKVGADVVLASATTAGKNIAPRVAVKLQAGLLADCVELTAQGDAVRPIYAGKARITVRPTTPIAVYTLRPNVFTAKKDADGTVAIENFAPSATSRRGVTVTSVIKNDGVLDVAEADMIVSGGRGLKGPENFHLVEELAKSLGAAVGASRAVVDAGWRPHSQQVGQTGKTVSPNLYVACGISGAVQHLAGMSSSKVIVAINKDKEAPIFTVADYGLVGDVFTILPKLTARISAVTGK